MSAPDARATREFDMNVARETHWRSSLLLFLGAAAFYAGCLDYTYNGDVIVYANIVATKTFDEFTIHQGYFLLLWALGAVLAPWKVIAPEVLAVWIAPAFGAASLVVTWHIARHFLARLAPPPGFADNDAAALRRLEAAPWLAVLIVAFSYRFYYNASSAEIYMPQTFGLLLSFLLFLRGQPVRASLPLLFALHVSPLTAFWCLFYPVVAWQRGWGWAPLLRLGIPTALVYLPFFAWYHQDLLWGTRGLLAVQDVQPFAPLAAAKNFVIFQGKHYTFTLLLLLPALAMVRRQRELFWVTLALFLPNLVVITKLEAEDNVFILTLDCFIGLWMTLGALKLAEQRRQWLAALLVGAHLLLFVVANRPWFAPQNEGYASELGALAERAQRERAMIVTHWEQRVGLVYYGRRTPSYPLEEGTIFEHTADAKTESPAAISAVRAAPLVYAYDYYSPSPIANLLLPDAVLRERATRASVVGLVERRFGMDCTLDSRGLLTLHRCVVSPDRPPVP